MHPCSRAVYRGVRLIRIAHGGDNVVTKKSERENSIFIYHYKQTECAKTRCQKAVGV